MSQWQKAEFDYEIQLAKCALYGDDGKEPHTVLEGKDALRGKVIYATITGYTGTAEYLFGFATGKAGITSHEQLIPAAAALEATETGSCEGYVDIPFGFPAGQIEYRSGSEVKAVAKVVFSVRFRVSPKKQ